ncbi:sensor histidine kinase [Paenibacillus sp. SYP-B4298]|uniref:sensor histidine kinase n=1 Tax=Paenibacillus sp. SYP-B4298 TaxID=2996034 RepID=UPI0022DCF74D|nr:HAMP domain-containing sensor histidine kinase [Paenibacillus sp. SYP-B4298]
MFTKLRNRFLLLNLVTISILMLVAFASIYTITYRNVENDVRMDLQRTGDFYLKSHNKPNRPQMGFPSTPQGGVSTEAGRSMGLEGMDRAGGPPPERLISFMISTNEQWELLQTDSQLDMDRELYVQALEKAADSGKALGSFSLNGSHWNFAVQRDSEGTRVIFLDTTARQSILSTLIYTFAVVGLVMLVLLFFTSRYFANRSIRPVQEAFEKQKQFIADASHELKTPLTIIHTNADVLLANKEDTIAQQAKWLHYIKSETSRMTKLTNDLLYLTEMDDSRTRMVHAKFNLSEAVENSILTMEAVIFEKQIRLDYNIEANLMVNGSSEQIKQVIMILLDNAVKYTVPKGTVEVMLKKQHHETVLAIRNTGEGIAPEHLTRIFDRFYRADSSRARKQGGHGLGLAIAKSIVDQHKGKLYAASTVGESTTFYMHLT